MRKKLFIVVFLLLQLPIIASAATYYVNATGGNDDWSGTSLSTPWKTIQKAANTATAGDTVYFRKGTYRGNLIPANSGSLGNYITFAAYPGENVTLTHNPSQDEYVVNLKGKSYIMIDGFILEGNWTGSWVEGYLSGNNNIIKNNIMQNCLRTKHGIYVSQGTHWQIINNTIHHGQPNASGSQGTDAISLHSNYHLVEGNHVENAEHAAVGAAASYIVIRNNYLSNAYNQVANSGGITGDKRILWENNTFIGSLSVPRDNGEAQGLQLNSQDTIVRHNVFYNAYSGGFEVSCYMTDGEAKDVHGNRLYNNVVFGNHDAGIKVFRYESGAVMSDNIFKNNVARRNRYNRDDSRKQQLYFGDYATGAVNFDYIVTSNKFINNAFSAETQNANAIGGTSDIGPEIVHNLTWWQNNYPANIANNIETDPKFVDENQHDFYLRADSPLIDAGTQLTQTASADSGTQVKVDDAKYFCDGFGMVSADWIKIGEQEPVQISSIDYDTNTIILTESRNWNDNDTVNLYKNSNGNIVLSGAAPDIGAYEYQGSTPPTCVAADLNCDSEVDVQDLIIVASDFGKTSNFKNAKSDTNTDGIVDIYDVVFVASRFT
jgi:hypothetical protein